MRTTNRGLQELVVRGLRHSDARALLEAAMPGRIEERVKDQIIAETRGNPLALLELPRGLTAAELAGGFVRPDARPLASQIEQSFLRRIRSLPDSTQRLLLVAAAEPVGDVPLLMRRAPRDRSGRGPTGPGSGLDRAWRASALPPPARAVGVVSRGRHGRPSERTSRVGRGDRS